VETSFLPKRKSLNGKSKVSNAKQKHSSGTERFFAATRSWSVLATILTAAPTEYRGRGRKNSSVPARKVAESFACTPKEAESVEYSVTQKSLDGQTVKVYRKYAVYAAPEPNGKKSFEEEIATIDSRGFFISVVDNEGTLDPKSITLIRKQTWDLKTKFKPVVAPK
jgi:hypothetical protein